MMLYVFSSILFLQQGGFQFPSGWSVLGFIVAALIAIVYLFSGTLQSLSTGRKELLEVESKRLANLQKEKDEADFQIKELQKQLEKTEKEKNDVEKEKTMLMREHHQLLEISVADLQTLKHNTRLIEQLEEEVNRYREEKGLQVRPRNIQINRDE